MSILGCLFQLYVIFSAAPIQLEITPSLVIDTQFLSKRERAPEQGFFLERTTMARRVTEIRHSSSSCDARVETIQQSVASEVQVIQAENQRLLEEYLVEIDTLAEGVTRMGARLDEAKDNLKWWRLGSLITTSVLLGTTTYLIVRNP